MLLLNTDNYLLTDTMSYTRKCSLYYHRVEKLKSSYVLIIIIFLYCWIDRLFALCSAQARGNG
jgi:hypothetical protein